MRPAPTDDPEIWLPVRGCEKYFEVSNHGQARRIRTANGKAVCRIIKPRRNLDGYFCVDLVIRKRIYTRSVARLVLFAFHGVPDFEGATASHLYPDKANNRWDNLLWETQEKNNARMKLFPNPFGRASLRIPDEHVREIRKRWKAGESIVSLADEYKAHPKYVLYIARGNARRKVV